MAGRSTTRTDTFSRGRLLVGLVLVTVVGGALVFGAAKLRGGPDAGRVVYASPQGVFSHELSSGKERTLATFPEGVDIAMPSPDGAYVAYTLGEGELWLGSLDGGERFPVAQNFTVPLGWAPDGRLIAGELLGDRDLVAVDPEGGREVLLSGGYATGTVPVWLDDDRFAIATDEDSFVIVDGTDPSRSIDGTPLAVSPDGAELSFATSTGVFVADVDGAKLGKARRISKADAIAAAASPSGYLAVATKRGVDVFTGGTDSTRVLDVQIDQLAWAKAGRVLLYSRKGAMYVLQLPDGEPKRISREGAEVFGLLGFVVS